MTQLTVNYSGAGELDDKVKMLVAGSSGSGKTRFALTAPNPIWANCLSGKGTLAMNPDTPFVNIQSEADLLTLKSALDRSPEERKELFGRPIDTLVVDTVDEFQRRLLAQRLASQKKELPSFDDWNWLGTRCNMIFSGLSSLDINVIFLLHTKHEVPEDRLFIKPALQGAFTDQICQYVDYAVVIKSYVDFGRVTELGEIQVNGLEINVSSDSEPTPFSYMITKPTREYEWLHDYTNSLPTLFDLNFIDDFEVIRSAREDVAAGLPASFSVDLEVGLINLDRKVSKLETVEQLGAKEVSLPPTKTTINNTTIPWKRN